MVAPTPVVIQEAFRLLLAIGVGAFFVEGGALKLKDGWPDRRRKLEVRMATGGRLLPVRLKFITREWRWEFMGGSYLIDKEDVWDYEETPSLAGK